MVHGCAALGGQKRVLEFLELEFQAPVSCSTRVLGIELEEQCAFLTDELANHTFSVSFSRDQCRFSFPQLPWVSTVQQSFHLDRHKAMQHQWKTLHCPLLSL